MGNWGTTGGGQEVNVPVENDTWYHVVGTYDGKELRIYLNGTLGKTFEWTVGEEEATIEAGFHSKGDLLVGGLPGKYAWDGFIDEVRLNPPSLSLRLRLRLRLSLNLSLSPNPNPKSRCGCGTCCATPTR